MKYLFTAHFINSIATYYAHVAMNYSNTYDRDDFIRNVNSSIDNAYSITNNSLPSKKRLLIWHNLAVTRIDKWYYAYIIIHNNEINDDIVVIIDACHHKNMVDSAFHLTLKPLSYYKSINTSAATNPPNKLSTDKAGRSISCKSSLIYTDDGYHYIVRKGNLPPIEHKYNKVIKDFSSKKDKIYPAVGVRDGEFYFIDYYTGKETLITNKRLIVKYWNTYCQKKARKKRLYESIINDINKIIKSYLLWGK